MKILDLEIANVRGVRALDLRPAGQNFLLWGPNGSGKSAVVDALDFLFTGQMTRLRGKGTAGISLDKHGPHIDAVPADAVVRARVLLTGIAEPIALERSIAKPTQLRYDKAFKEHVEPVLQLASRGQQTLTRREILKYITAEASTRAQEIQAILNLSEIEDARKAIVRVHNDCDKEATLAKRTVEQFKTTVQSLTGMAQYVQADVLAFVNQHRAVLGGNPLALLSASFIKAELSPPAMATAQKVNTALVAKDIEATQKTLSESARAEITGIEDQLRTAYEAVATRPDLVRSHARQQLVQIGLSLLDDTGACPLCDTPWAAGELRPRLESRLGEAQAINDEQGRVANLSSDLSARVGVLLPLLARLIAAADSVGLPEAAAQLKAWRDHFTGFLTNLTHFAERFPTAGPYSLAFFRAGDTVLIPSGFPQTTLIPSLRTMPHVK